MFTVIGVMLGGMLIGFLLRRQEFSWIGKVITLLIWALLFLLGIEVGGNRQIVEGLETARTGRFLWRTAARTSAIKGSGYDERHGIDSGNGTGS